MMQETEMLSQEESLHQSEPLKGVALDQRAQQFRSSLESISKQAKSERECRDSILEAVVRSPYFLGGAWSFSNGTDASLEADRLAGPVFERDDIQNWIKQGIAHACRQSDPLVIRSTMVRNVFAVHVPVEIQHTPDRPQCVLTLVTTESGERVDSSKILAAQCAVNAWRGWFTSNEKRVAQRHLRITSQLLELEMRIVREPTSARACQMAVESLQEQLGCRLVAIGLSSGRGICRLNAISGMASFDRKSAVVTHMESALNESLIRQQLTSWPATQQSQIFQTLAHKRAAESLGVESIVSVPLENGAGEVVGAALFGGSGSQLLPQQKHNELRACSAPVGSAITAVRRAEGGPVRKLSQAVLRTFSKSRGLVMAFGVLLAFAVLLMPVTYRIPCACQIEPIKRFYCLAPYEGLVEETLFEAGDQVGQDELLGRMDGREIAWELSGVTADRARALKELDVFLSERQVAKAIQAELESQRLAARTQLLQYRRDHMDLRSPTAGIILGDSIDKRSNYPVKKGQLLYEIAPLENLRIEVAIPSEELAHVAEGHEVEIRINGQSNVQLRGEIQKIRPQSETRNGVNVFVAEVEVENPDGVLRPGMEGTARIVSGRYPLIWNYGHRFAERTMSALWW